MGLLTLANATGLTLATMRSPHRFCATHVGQPICCASDCRFANVSVLHSGIKHGIARSS